jgi:hypothetical protein
LRYKLTARFHDATVQVVDQFIEPYRNECSFSCEYNIMSAGRIYESLGAMPATGTFPLPVPSEDFAGNSTE